MIEVDFYVAFQQRTRTSRYLLRVESAVGVYECFCFGLSLTWFFNIEHCMFPLVFVQYEYTSYD